MKVKSCCMIGSPKISFEIIPYTYQQLVKETKHAISAGYNHFILGIAPGLDMLYADVILKLQKQHAITFEVVAAYKNQFTKTQNSTCLLLEKATKITAFQDAYDLHCLKNRNLSVIKRCSLIIAVHDGKKSDTARSSIRHAYAIGKDVHMIDLS